MPANQQYNPLDPQPYTPPQLPEVQAPPVPQIAQEPARITETPKAKIGNIAQLLDSGFRGYMAGKADKTARDVMKFKRQNDNLQAASAMASQNLQGMVQSGALTDQQAREIHQGKRPDGMNDEQFNAARQAVGAVDGTWSAMMDFQGQHIGAMGGGAKKGKKKDQGGGADNPLAMLSSNDPAQKMQGAYALRKQMGPSVYFQLGDSKAIQQRKQQTANENESGAIASDLNVRTDRLHKDLADQNALPQSKERDDKIAGIKQQITAMAPDAKEKVPTNPFQGNWEAAIAENGGRPLNAKQAQHVAEISQTEKTPTSKLAGAVEAFVRGNDGKQPTYEQYKKIVKEIDDIDPIKQMREDLAKQRLDDQQQRQVDTLTRQAETDSTHNTDTIHKRMADLNAKTQRLGSQAAQLNLDTPEGKAEYKKEAQQIEKDDYAKKIQIGADLQRKLAEHGIEVDIPVPEPWETSNLGAEGGKPEQAQSLAAEYIKTHTPKPIAVATKKNSASQNSEELPAEAKAKLKKGHKLTFGNGSAWTLDDNGKPVMLSPPTQGQ